MYGALAVLVTLGTFATLGYIVVARLGGENALFAIITGLFGALNLALGFYFGSNKQAADVTRQKIVDANKPPCDEIPLKVIK